MKLEVREAGALGIAVALLSASYLAPGHYPPWPAFQSELLAALSALACGLALIVTTSRHVLVPRMAVLMGLLALVPLVQHLVGQVWFLSDAVLCALYLFGFGACIVIGASLRSQIGVRLTDGLAGALVLAGMASTLIAILQWQRLNASVLIVDLAAGLPPYGNLAQRNHFATLVVLGMLGTLHLYERRCLRAVATACIALLLGFGLAMTESRTGWLEGVLVLCGTAAFARKAHLRLRPVATLAFGLVVLVMILSWGPLNRALLLAPPESLAGRMQPGRRIVLLPTLLDGAWHKPWFGFGWGQVILAQQSGLPGHPANGAWMLESHNLLLDLAIYNGFPIAIALAAVLGVWLLRQFAGCRTGEQWALLAAVCALGVHAMLEYPLHYAFFLLPLGLMVGVLSVLRPAAPPPLRIPRGAFAAAWVCAALMTAWVSAEYLRVESTLRDLRFVMSGIGVDKVWKVDLPRVVLLDQQREVMRFWQTPARRGMSADELEWMRKVVLREPRPPAMLRYALALGLNGRAAQAQQTLQSLCLLHLPQRCDEGRDSWRLLRKQFPELERVRYPQTPAAFTESAGDAPAAHARE